MPSTLNFDHLLNPGVELKPFQTVGVAYAIVAKRTFIADEMGLGKTLQSLAVLEATNSYPAVVVCPASLKGNWAKEIKRFTGRSVEVVSGRTGALSGQADITVVNYDLLSARLPQLLALAPRALVADESHYLKEGKAQRSKAALTLAQAIPADGVVLCLTGTPLLNRPVELVNQLRILGRLADVAPRPRRGTSDRDYEFSFKFAYCGAEQNAHGWDFKGASNLTELNERMRRSCYVRRQRDVVLDLEKTNRQPVTVSLNGALDTYRAAEGDFIRWVYESKGASAARKARQAEALTLLNTLRKLVGEAKVAAAIEWIDNFLDSNPDRPIVVFAQHVAVQQALAAHYACPTIFGGQSTESIEEAKRAFMAGEARVIVLSLSAAREGHTLTAASDVLFAELPWHAGAFDQAADRVNRIGQTRQVFAWSLLAEGTIDERLMEILDSKRSIFQSAAEGTIAPETDDEESTVDALLKAYGG